MKWMEVEVSTNSYGSELVADILTDFNEEGVAIYDTSDIAMVLKSDIIWDYIDEKLLVASDKVLVKTSIPVDGFSNNYALLLSRLQELTRRADQSVGSLEITYHEIDDEDWFNVWKKFYQPIKVGGITIVPRWLNYKLEEGELPLYIDPGMAFGTGEHETTQLCIALAGSYELTGKSVIDIGCGSGILGISAAVRGASKVYLSDIDPVAMVAARGNCNINTHVNSEFILSQDDLLAKATVKADLIFANITADILIRLAGDIGRCLKSDGVIVLSGIIKQRYDEVVAAYLEQDYRIVESRVMGEWCALTMSR